MIISYCKLGCCKFINTDNIITEPLSFKNDNDKYSRRAGICLICKKSGKIILSQSYNNFWGIPKGRIEDGESEKTAALRELKEETGIDLNEKNLNEKNIFISVISGAWHKFYIVETPEELDIHNPDLCDNESSGVVWCNPNCALKLKKINKVSKQLIQFINKK